MKPDSGLETLELHVGTGEHTCFVLIMHPRVNGAMVKLIATQYNLSTV